MFNISMLNHLKVYRLSLVFGDIKTQNLKKHITCLSKTIGSCCTMIYLKSDEIHLFHIVEKEIFYFHYFLT